MRAVRRFGQVVDVILLALAPRRLRRLERVAALTDDLGDLVAELLPDLRQGRFAALVLGGVVQQCGDGLRLGAIRLDDKPGHR